AKTTSEKDSLAMVVAQKDSILNDAFMSIDEIASGLSQISQREKLVTSQSSGEITRTAKAEIQDNIAAISDLLEKNRQQIASLKYTQKKLKEAGMRIEALDNLVNSLQGQIESKNGEIAELAQKVESLNIEVGKLTDNIRSLEGEKTELKGEVAQKTEELNTVYYVIGVEKELMKAEIIDKEGFIGRTAVLGRNAGDMSKFTKGDMRTLERVKVGGKKAKIVSSHPESSYMMVLGAKNMVEEIVITDKNAFWKNSKVLIVSYK
ncbi:MAG: hypothetical protein RSA50_07305, partial [Mucinivorans sp.]